MQCRVLQKKILYNSTYSYPIDMAHHEQNIKSIYRLTSLTRWQIIGLHILLWICFLFFPLLIYRIDFFNKQFFTYDLINNAFLIGLFYFNYYYLIPKYFNGKRIGAYFTIVVGCIILFIFQQMYAGYLFIEPESGKPFFTPGFQMHKENFDSLHFPPFHHRANAFPNVGEENEQGFFNMPAFFWIGSIRRSLSGILSILLAGSFARVAMQWLNSEKRKEELEIQKLNDELGLLKAQINPHFLFNSLNSVYSLARKNSPHTEVFILKLSDILRYVIYESSAQQVMLSHELTYISNYIELQKYRIDKGMPVLYECRGEPGNLVIEPMLLITFIENAFKHGVSYREGSFIHITIDIHGIQLRINVQNTYNLQPGSLPYGGVGLQNARKRLQLSYPDKHELAITDENNIYHVQLKIELNHD